MTTVVLTGTGTLVRHVLRRDRVRLPVWVLSLLGVVGASAVAVQGLYDEPAEQAAYAATVGTSTATVAMNGPPVALDTLGGITVYEVTLTALIGVALMATFLTLRHTRADEEAGRTEMLRAGVLGRQADLAAVGLVVSGACVAVGGGTAGLFVVSGLPVSGSVLYGASVAGLGLVFVGVALVAAQVAQHSRTATGLTLTVLAAAYVVRAFGDVMENGWVWASPVGWAQAVHAYGDERWWPLLLSLLLATALAGLASWLTTRRDFGAGLVPDRLGPATAAPYLSGAFGLAFRLQRGSIAAWSAGLGLLGVVYGALGEDVQEMLEENPALAELFEQLMSGATAVDAYFAIILPLQGLLAAGYTISAVLRLRAEEAAVRAEPLLATPLSRTRWAGSWLLVTALGTAAVMLSGGVGTGMAFWAVSGDGGEVLGLTLATLSYLPATLLLGAIAAAPFGWAPRAGMVAWAALAVFFVIAWLGELLELPAWFMGLSPYDRSPQVPLEDYAAAPLLVIGGLALALVALGLAGFRRRDLVTD